MRNTIINNKKPVSRRIKLSNIKGAFNKYKISINDLWLNPFNDRMAKEILSWEKKNKTELAFDKKSQKWLKDTLLSIKPSKNERTRKDILRNDIQQHIVVDLSGVILDGNRRVSILKDTLENKRKYKNNNLSRFEELEVIVVEEILTREKIHDFETKLQISEDEKLEYDPINMYLKVSRLFEESDSLSPKDKREDVAQKMGAKYTANKIKEYLNTFEMMKMYLSWAGEKDNYELLSHREDHFKNIAKFHAGAVDKKIKTSDIKINNEYVHRVLDVLFVYASKLYEGKAFRKFVPNNTSTVTTPLSTEVGLKAVEERLEKFGLLKEAKKNPSVKYESNEESEKMESIMTSSLALSTRKDISLPIKDTLRKLRGNVSKVMEWSNSIIGEANVNQATVGDIEEAIDNLNSVLRKLD